jgi:hypothetical protein
MRTKAEEADIQCATKTGQLNSISTAFVGKILNGQFFGPSRGGAIASP